MNIKHTKLYCFIIFTIFVLVNLNCDSWQGPSKMEYISQNKKFTFITKPSISVLIKLKKCRGTLYENLTNGKKRKIWSQSLVNDRSPYGALIHKEGKFVVTFNDYAYLGYGENVVVIYDNTGKLIKRFSLTDIIDYEEQWNLKHSVSSIWWMGNHTIIDSQNILLLEIPFYSNFSNPEPHKFEYVLIDLNTGKLIEKFKSYNILNEQQILDSKNREEFLKPKKNDLISIQSIFDNIETAKVDTLLGIVHPIIDEDFRSYYESPVSIRTLYDISPELCLNICYYECANFPEISIKEASIIGTYVKDDRLSAELLACFNRLTELLLNYNEADDLRLWNEYSRLYSEVLNSLMFQKPNDIEKILIEAFDQFESKAEETKNNYRNVITRLFMTLLHGSPKEVDQFQFYKYNSYLLVSQLNSINSNYNIQKGAIETEIAKQIRVKSFFKDSKRKYKIIEDSILVGNEMQTLNDVVTNPILIEEILNNLEIVKQSKIEVSYNNLCNPIIIGEMNLAFSFFIENQYITILSFLDKKVKIKVIGPIDVYRDKY